MERERERERIFLLFFFMLCVILYYYSDIIMFTKHFSVEFETIGIYHACISCIIM